MVYRGFQWPRIYSIVANSITASRSLQTSEAGVVDSEVVLEEGAVVPLLADSQQMEKSQ